MTLNVHSPERTRSQYIPSLKRLRSSASVTGLTGIDFPLMINVDQIRALLEELVRSKISVDGFEDRLTQASWNMHKDSSTEAIEMVGKIESQLVRYAAGEMSFATMINNFKGMSPLYIAISFDVDRPFTTAGSSSVNSTRFPLVSSAASHKQLESGFSCIPLLPVRQ
jgi:hypothetical protein